MIFVSVLFITLNSLSLPIPCILLVVSQPVKACMSTIALTIFCPSLFLNSLISQICDLVVRNSLCSKAWCRIMCNSSTNRSVSSPIKETSLLQQHSPASRHISTSASLVEDITFIPLAVRQFCKRHNNLCLFPVLTVAEELDFTYRKFRIHRWCDIRTTIFCSFHVTHIFGAMFVAIKARR